MINFCEIKYCSKHNFSEFLSSYRWFCNFCKASEGLSCSYSDTSSFSSHPIEKRSCFSSELSSQKDCLFFLFFYFCLFFFNLSFFFFFLLSFSCIQLSIQVYFPSCINLFQYTSFIWFIRLTAHYKINICPQLLYKLFLI